VSATESVDVIYLDPLFNSKAAYSVSCWRISRPQFQAAELPMFARLGHHGRGGAVPLEVRQWYEFYEFVRHLRNIGSNKIEKAGRRLFTLVAMLAAGLSLPGCVYVPPVCHISAVGNRYKVYQGE